MKLEVWGQYSAKSMTLSISSRGSSSSSINIFLTSRTSSTVGEYRFSVDEEDSGIGFSASSEARGGLNRYCPNLGLGEVAFAFAG